jgi:hypothetical protein
MRTRLLRGNTAQNNAITLPPGTVTINTDDNSLRLHDGVTRGGFEIKTRAAFDMGPGPKTLQAGTFNSGFLGEMTDAELFSGDILALNVGLSAGTTLSDTGGWLKFIHKGKILYVAKKPLRNYISWDDLYKTGIVHGVEGPGPNLASDGTAVDQLTVVPFDDYAVKVRVLTGTDTDPSNVAGGEYDALIKHLTEGIWPLGYTRSALGAGNWEHTPAVYEGSPTNRVLRNPTSISSAPAGTAGSSYLWRPCLELISKDDILFEARPLGFEVGGALYPLILDDLDFSNVLSPVRRTDSAFFGMPGVTFTEAEFVDVVTGPNRLNLDWSISELDALIFTDHEYVA